MKRTLINLSLCAIALTLVATACKKKDEKSTKDKIVGTWKMKQLIVDANGNGNADDAAMDFDTLNLTIAFQSNGNGMSMQAGAHTGSFTWSVNGNYIVLTDSGATTPESLLIVSGPDSKMTLKDSSEHPNQFSVLQKQ